ncbi:hypothetical protein [Aureispira anguillae]|uniref:Uncharacterized protein n=1 Tax=Aureispira anguillae TaxID=2864201 RepID=A0A915YIW7_9BACT|nr:hypothetical protein [Aureispira anguillae]BDS13928.1 hypothetical protein AsAng_0046910 [Aureispira anguillae]
MNYTLAILSSFLLLTQMLIGQSAQVQDYALDNLRGIELNSNNLVIYEEQAILKLQDMLDYMALIGSSQYNDVLRETAMETVLANFDETARVSCDWVLNNGLEQAKDGASCTPVKMLKELFAAAYYEIKVNYETVRINQPLKKLPDGNYRGQLLYQQEVATQKIKNTPSKMATPKAIKIDFLLERVEKKFGDEQEIIWEIKFLGML